MTEDAHQKHDKDDSNFKFTIKQILEVAARNRVSLKNANLRNANLRNANLRNANLRNANLRNANLRNADLRNANLWNANLRNADLRNADLWNANLWNANLWNARLNWDSHNLIAEILRQAALKTDTPGLYCLAAGHVAMSEKNAWCYEELLEKFPDELQQVKVWALRVLMDYRHDDEVIPAVLQQAFETLEQDAS